MTSGWDFDTGNGLLVLMQPKSSLQTATITGIDAAFYCDMGRRREVLWNTVELIPPPPVSESFMSLLFLLFFQQRYHSRGDCTILIGLFGLSETNSSPHSAAKGSH